MALSGKKIPSFEEAMRDRNNTANATPKSKSVPSFEEAMQLKKKDTTGQPSATGTKKTSQSTSPSTYPSFEGAISKTPNDYFQQPQVTSANTLAPMNTAIAFDNFKNKKATPKDISLLKQTSFGKHQNLDKIPDQYDGIMAEAHNGEKPEDVKSSVASLFNQFTPPSKDPQHDTDKKSVLDILMKGDDVETIKHTRDALISNLKSQRALLVNKSVGGRSSTFVAPTPIKNVSSIQSIEDEKNKPFDEIDNNISKINDAFNNYIVQSIVNKRDNQRSIDVETSPSTGRGATPKFSPYAAREVGEGIGKMIGISHESDNNDYNSTSAGVSAIVSNLTRQRNDLLSKGLPSNDISLLNTANEIQKKIDFYKKTGETLDDQFPDVGTKKTARIISDKIAELHPNKIVISSEDVHEAANKINEANPSFIDRYGKFVDIVADSQKGYFDTGMVSRGGVSGGLESGITDVAAGGAKFVANRLGDKETAEKADELSSNERYQGTSFTGYNPTKIVYDDKEKAYRQEKNENYGKVNWNSSVFKIAKGIPNLAEFVLVDKGFGGLAKAGLEGVAAIPEAVQAATMAKQGLRYYKLGKTAELTEDGQKFLGLLGANYRFSYDDNYKLATENIKGDGSVADGKRAALANLYTLLSTGVFHAAGFSPSKFVEKAIAKSSTPELMSILEKKGWQDLTSKEANSFVSNTLLPKVQSFVKQSASAIKEGSKVGAASVVDQRVKEAVTKLMNPNAQTNDDDVKTFVEQTMMMSLTGMVGAIRTGISSPSLKDAMYEGGLYAPQYIDRIKGMLDRGEIEEKEANESISMLKTLGEEVQKAGFSKNSKGLPTIDKQKKELAINNFRKRAAEYFKSQGHDVNTEEIANTVDASNKEVLDQNHTTEIAESETFKNIVRLNPSLSIKEISDIDPVTEYNYTNEKGEVVKKTGAELHNILATKDDLNEPSGQVEEPSILEEKTTENLTPTIIVDGKEYSGKNHGEAMEKARAAGENVPDPNTEEGKKWREEHGMFKDKNGELLSREKSGEKYGIRNSEELADNKKEQKEQKEQDIKFPKRNDDFAYKYFNEEEKKKYADLEFNGDSEGIAKMIEDKKQELLSQPKEQAVKFPLPEKPVDEMTADELDKASNGGGDVEIKQQIENFGVNKDDLEPVHNVISQVFNGLKKAGLTAAKTVGDWVGLGKGIETDNSLKQNLGGGVKNSIPEKRMADVTLMDIDELNKIRTQPKGAKNGLYGQDPNAENISTIQSEGIKNPLTVIRKENSDGSYTYKLDNGHNRLDEAERLGAKKLPVIIRDSYSGEVIKSNPLFKDAEAQYRIESGKNIVEAIKDFNGSPRATVALTHEIMHPTVVAIIDGAKEGNAVGTKHTETIVNEFNKVVREKNNNLKIVQDATENEYANSKLTKQDNPIQEPSIKAIESKTESNDKAELNEVIEQADAKINAATDVKTVPLKFISTDEARFQNRNELNKQIVDDIAKNWSDANQDPIHVWTDPKNGKTYVLSGHHRFYGAKEAERESVKIVDRTNDFTESEAIKFAKEEANANRSMESSIERAKALREKIKRGDSKEEINKFLEREGKNKTFVQNMAALNPKGKAMQTLEQFGNAGDRQTQKETEQRADWIGEARRIINGLTDAHENELFDFLFDKDASKRVTTKADLLQKVRSVVRPLEPNEPLNIARFKQKTTGEAAYDETVNNKKAEIADRQEKINSINDRFSNPQNKDYISTDSKDYSTARKIADVKISTLESERKLLQKQLEDIYRNKGSYTGAASSGTLFKDGSEIPFDKEITAEDLIKWNDDFKQGKTNEQYRAVQEFIAKSWEKYHREGGKGFSESFQKVLDQITQAFKSVYKSISGKELTPELRKMFDEILGKEAVEQSLSKQESGGVGKASNVGGETEEKIISENISSQTKTIQDEKESDAQEGRTGVKAQEEDDEKADVEAEGSDDKKSEPLTPEPPTGETSSEEGRDEWVGISKKDLSETVMQKMGVLPTITNREIVDEANNMLSEMADSSHNGNIIDAAKEYTDTWHNRLFDTDDKGRTARDSEGRPIIKKGVGIPTEMLGVMGIRQSYLSDQLKRTDDLSKQALIANEMDKVDEILRASQNISGRNLQFFQTLFKMSDEGKVVIQRNVLGTLIGHEIPTNEKALNEQIAILKEGDKRDIEKAAKLKEAYDHISKLETRLKEATAKAEQFEERVSREDFDKAIKEAEARGEKTAESLKSTKPEKPFVPRTKAAKLTIQTFNEKAEQIRNSKTLDAFGFGAAPEGVKAQGFSASAPLKESIANAVEKIGVAVARGIDKASAIADAVQEIISAHKGEIEEDQLRHGFESIYSGYKNTIDTPTKLMTIKKEAEVSNTKTLTPKMVDDGMVSDLIDSYLNRGVEAKDVLENAHNDLKSILPDVTKRQVIDAYLKKGEFEQESVETKNNRVKEQTNELRNIANLERTNDMLRKGEEIFNDPKNANKIDSEVVSSLKKERDLLKQEKQNEETKKKIDDINAHLKTWEKIVRSAKMGGEVIAKMKYENKKAVEDALQKQGLKLDRSAPDIILKNREASNAFNKVIDGIEGRDLSHIKIKNVNDVDSLEEKINKAIHDVSREMSKIDKNDPSYKSLLEARNDLLDSRKKTHEAVKINSAKRKMEGDIRKIKNDIAAGRFTAVKSPTQLKIDREFIKLNAERNKARAEYDKAEAKFIYQNRSMAGKAFEMWLRFRRGSLVSSLVSTMTKLPGSALAKMVSDTITTNILGSKYNPISYVFSHLTGLEKSVSAQRVSWRGDMEGFKTTFGGHLSGIKLDEAVMNEAKASMAEIGGQLNEQKNIAKSELAKLKKEEQTDGTKKLIEEKEKHISDLDQKMKDNGNTIRKMRVEKYLENTDHVLRAATQNVFDIIDRAEKLKETNPKAAKELLKSKEYKDAKAAFEDAQVNSNLAFMAQYLGDVWKNRVEQIREGAHGLEEAMGDFKRMSLADRQAIHSTSFGKKAEAVIYGIDTIGRIHAATKDLSAMKQFVAEYVRATERAIERKDAGVPLGEDEKWVIMQKSFDHGFKGGKYSEKNRTVRFLQEQSRTIDRLIDEKSKGGTNKVVQKINSGIAEVGRSIILPVLKIPANIENSGLFKFTLGFPLALYRIGSEAIKVYKDVDFSTKETFLKNVKHFGESFVEHMESLDADYADKIKEGLNKGQVGIALGMTAASMVASGNLVFGGVYSPGEKKRKDKKGNEVPYGGVSVNGVVYDNVFTHLLSHIPEFMPVMIAGNYMQAYMDTDKSNKKYQYQLAQAKNKAADGVDGSNIALQKLETKGAYANHNKVLYGFANAANVAIEESPLRNLSFAGGGKKTIADWVSGNIESFFSISATRDIQQHIDKINDTERVIKDANDRALSNIGLGFLLEKKINQVNKE